MRDLKIIITLLLVCIINPSLAQDYSKDWTGHYSYLDIKDISQGNNKVFGAAENAIFIYDIQTKKTEKLSTINGLSGETISSIQYVEDLGVLLIGFDNGLIQVYTESNQEILSVVDILDKATIPSNTKKINHFNIFNEIAYISTDFGISLYDIQSLEFGDTYFIGAAGAQSQINQTTIFNDFIYSASLTGIQRAEINNPNLIDYKEWELVIGGNWNAIEGFDNKIYATQVTNKSIYEFDIITAPNVLVTYQDIPLDLRNENEQLTLTTKSEIFVYSPNFTQLVNINSNDYNQTQFIAGFISEDRESIYAGTEGIVNVGKSGFGILKININDLMMFEELHPDGPLLNRFFQVKTQAGDVWGTHGGHDEVYNVFQGIRRTGISHLSNAIWQNISYSTIEATITEPWALSYIAPNPFNENLVYISSGFSGLIEIQDNQPRKLFNQDNSTIAPIDGTVFNVTLASHYDKDGALWLATSRNERILNKFKDNQWESFDLAQVIPSPGSNLGISDISSDDEGSLFMGSHNFGLIGFKENNGNPILRNISGPDENLPTTGVTAVEVDKRDQVWIGTNRGLRVIFNTDNFFDNPNYNPSEIIVLDNGEASELLFQQYITDIEVDGANNKWIGTLDSGLFYFSSDGQETILRFTKDNSPLPSNDILDISIDDNTGLVYIATEKGLLAYNSQSSGPKDNFDDAFVFPNPVRPNFNIVDEKIKIRDISENVNIKITDVAGNLVAEAESNTNTRFNGYNLEIDGGTALWNGKNLVNEQVASGVYLVMLSDLESLETKVLKVMIVR